MSTPCIITVAITGSLPREENNPVVPITVAEQVESTQAIVTGHDSFAAVIPALRTGADDYLPEPVDMNALIDSLLGRERPSPRIPDTPLAAARIRWEHIHRVFAHCGHDIRETAQS